MRQEDLLSSARFTCKKAFSLNGRRYQVGDNFDHKRRAITNRRLRQLFDANWIMLSDKSEPKQKPEPVVEPKPVLKPKQTMTMDEPEEEDF